nr:envelope protein UL78 [Mastomys natalensis cytomegalovirus 3]WEG69904.1 envelope protein UL78 [Mastomys natalensis cytomegalovirus 3]WEG70044.1 envelope protein UL78 [Mastomys natalensis cytomegalovirus 3]WEG70184.1 envelope protein UL78 [Mastomys natalensis cytomegalovirus 3]WEG70324.1 envelope protein UL78 [Mastomys natalensis cytomegalovirus 3]
MAGYCNVPTVTAGFEEARFAGIYESATVGTFIAVCLASVALMTVTGIAALWKRRVVGIGLYVISLIVADVIQIIVAFCIWGIRSLCPGAISEFYCRVVLLLGNMSEAAASFFYLYLVLDRICILGGLTEKRVYGTNGGKNMKGVLWVTFVAWTSSFILASPILTGSVVYSRPGITPVCEMQGPDNITQLMMHTAVTFVLPSLFLITKNIEARRRTDDGAVWNLMRKACVFYSTYFFLTIPVVLTKVASFFAGGSKYPSYADYLGLVGTTVYQLRLVDFMFGLDVVLAPKVYRREKDRQDSVTSAEDKELPRRGACGVRGFLEKCSQSFKKWFQRITGKFNEVLKKDSSEDKKPVTEHEEIVADCHELSENSNSVVGCDNPGYESHENGEEFLKEEGQKGNEEYTSNVVPTAPTAQFAASTQPRNRGPPVVESDVGLPEYEDDDFEEGCASTGYYV